MSGAATPALRRVITGLNAAGRSIAAIDGPPAAQVTFEGGAGLYEIWATPAGPLSRAAAGPDRGAGDVTISPPAGGVKVRWFTITPSEPLAPDEAEALFAAAFAAVGAAHERVDTSRHPGMHLTPTIDAIIVVSGRVRLILDEDERVLGPGDVVVQRGTNHAWVCEGEEPALLVAVLISKDFAQGEADATQSRGAALDL